MKQEEEHHMKQEEEHHMNQEEEHQESILTVINNIINNTIDKKNYLPAHLELYNDISSIKDLFIR